MNDFLKKETNAFIHSLFNFERLKFYSMTFTSIFFCIWYSNIFTMLDYTIALMFVLLSLYIYKKIIWLLGNAMIAYDNDCTMEYSASNSETFNNIILNLVAPYGMISLIVLLINSLFLINVIL